MKTKTKFNKIAKIKVTKNAIIYLSAVFLCWQCHKYISGNFYLTVR